MIIVIVFGAIGKDPSVLLSSPEKPSTKDEPSTTLPLAITTATPAVATSSTAASSVVGSHDTRTQPRAQVPRGREQAAPVISRVGHIQPTTVPETVTPFVTTQHPGQGLGGVLGGKKELTTTGLDIHTPLGVGSKQQQQNKNSGGLPYAIATPANLQGRTSSM